MPGGNEYLLNNVVGEDLQKSLRPFDLVRKLLLVSKYRIRDKFITPHPRKYYVLSLVILLVFLYAYKDISYCMSYNWCLMIIYALHPVAYATVIATAAYQSESAVNLVTKMQELNKKLKVLGASVLPTYPRSAYMQLISGIILDLEILYAAFIVDFLLSRLEAWTTVFVNAVRRPNINTLESNDIGGNTTALLMLKTVKGILEAFSILEIISRCVILLHAALIIVQSLFNANTLIMLAKIEITITQTFVLALFIFLLSLTPVIALVLLSVNCERFDCSIEKVKKACVVILEDTSYEEKSTRRLAKNVLRLCNVRYSKMRACGLFTIDAGLPLRMLNLITTYCIVLLQFAFL
ncbi:hypothetical protein EVAR_59561_1 [Eumeta japonica]|uniref:Gustatory receptor n=1 Tax=Eumeta variegata TaxID=151549 RepID=A0A4C1YQP3_EUMVA|nr:hypothetical protein EVAR_59561_1 [Eumeta japonica]